MSADLLFDIAGMAAMVGWFILILLPRGYTWLNRLSQYIIPLGLSILYVLIFIPTFSTIEGGGFGSLAEVKALLSHDAALLGGWIHYLAFDLFIGGWIARRSDMLGISRFIQAPILLATFMLGPLGLVLFFITQSVRHRFKTIKG